MKRGSLVLIGITSAVATLVSLNVIFGRSWGYHDGYYHRHSCSGYYNDREKNSLKHGDTGKYPSTGKY